MNTLGSRNTSSPVADSKERVDLSLPELSGKIGIVAVHEFAFDIQRSEELQKSRSSCRNPVPAGRRQAGLAMGRSQQWSDHHVERR
jgi:hypothetical protein